MASASIFVPPTSIPMRIFVVVIEPLATSIALRLSVSQTAESSTSATTKNRELDRLCSATEPCPADAASATRSHRQWHSAPRILDYPQPAKARSVPPFLLHRRCAPGP